MHEHDHGTCILYSHNLVHESITTMLQRWIMIIMYACICSQHVDAISLWNIDVVEFMVTQNVIEPTDSECKCNMCLFLDPTNNRQMFAFEKSKHMSITRFDNFWFDNIEKCVLCLSKGGKGKPKVCILGMRHF